mmetsp:Transcript_2946/g.6133  ORF Transcript_2946/g.6133 Transcript_2946/m.6133 type:complete len:106 (+) Transcript_2946:516-833(+)
MRGAIPYNFSFFYSYPSHPAPPPVAPPDHSRVTTRREPRRSAYALTLLLYLKTKGYTFKFQLQKTRGLPHDISYRVTGNPHAKKTPLHRNMMAYAHMFEEYTPCL